MNRSKTLLAILPMWAWFALLPPAHALNPAPDGCYPNFTTAEGCDALHSLTIGAGNTGFGWRSLFLNTDGSFNTGVGGGALALNDGTSNTAVGAAALLLNTTGGQNTAVGTDSLVLNDSGGSNTASGSFALMNNTTGSFNEALGVNALASNDSGFYNVAIGDDTLSNNVSGSHNIIIGGFSAGFNIIAGSNNIYIGPGVSANGHNDESGAIRIDDSAPAAGGSTSQVFFAGIDGSTVGAVNSPVLVNPNGQLGTPVSSARFKKDIEQMGKTSEAIFSLSPVTFHYKGDTTNTPQFGLIAEEVAKANPALILVDKQGKPYSVRYDQINAMLLNEFLKEHNTVEQLKKEVAALTATVREQATEIQKVSTKLEVSGAGEVAVNQP